MTLNRVDYLAFRSVWLPRIFPLLAMTTVPQFEAFQHFIEIFMK
jgi:hypothetical protein